MLHSPLNGGYIILRILTYEESYFCNIILLPPYSETVKQVSNFLGLKEEKEKGLEDSFNS
jgi:hypothetical protein